jgi:apolipoprotein N-acyltransferase
MKKTSKQLMRRGWLYEGIGWLFIALEWIGIWLDWGTTWVGVMTGIAMVFLTIGLFYFIISIRRGRKEKKLTL